jgi:hypothetical protein
MIVDRNRESLLRVILPNALEVQLALDLGRFGDVDSRPMLAVLRGQFLIEDLFAKDDAIVANVNTRTRD